MTRFAEHPRTRALSALAALLLFTAWPALAQSPEKPKPPPDEWNGTNFVTAYTASVSAAGDPFDMSVHAAMTPKGKICSEELNKAIYRQDIGHMFESRAHFDNCAFKESLAYIEALIGEARDKIAGIQDTDDDDGVPQELLNAMFALGQALHAMQDFYAHTNYVELMQKQNPGMTDEANFPIVELWKPASSEQLLNLAANGLVSGCFTWSLPHLCGPGVPSHSELAKDSPGTNAGAQLSIFINKLTGQRLTNYTIAFNLASRTTREFLRWVGYTSPQVEKFCGSTLKYIVQSDRRPAD